MFVRTLMSDLLLLVRRESSSVNCEFSRELASIRDSDRSRRAGISLEYCPAEHLNDVASTQEPDRRLVRAADRSAVHGAAADTGPRRSAADVAPQRNGAAA